MSQFDKRLEKFYKVPVPKDITYDELFYLAEKHGCLCESGGKHSHIAYPQLRIVIPIPIHGKCVNEVYIKQVKELFSAIEELER